MNECERKGICRDVVIQAAWLADNAFSSAERHNCITSRFQMRVAHDSEEERMSQSWGVGIRRGPDALLSVDTKCSRRIRCCLGPQGSGGAKGERGGGVPQIFSEFPVNLV